MDQFTTFEALKFRVRDGLLLQVHGYDDHNVNYSLEAAIEKARRAANKRRKPQVVFQLVVVVHPEPKPKKA